MADQTGAGNSASAPHNGNENQKKTPENGAKMANANSQEMIRRRRRRRRHKRLHQFKQELKPSSFPKKPVLKQVDRKPHRGPEGSDQKLPKSKFINKHEKPVRPFPAQLKPETKPVAGQETALSNQDFLAQPVSEPAQTHPAELPPAFDVEQSRFFTATDHIPPESEIPQGAPSEPQSEDMPFQNPRASSSSEPQEPQEPQFSSEPQEHHLESQSPSEPQVSLPPDNLPAEPFLNDEAVLPFAPVSQPNDEVQITPEPPVSSEPQTITPSPFVAEPQEYLPESQFPSEPPQFSSEQQQPSFEPQEPPQELAPEPQELAQEPVPDLAQEPPQDLPFSAEPPPSEPFPESPSPISVQPSPPSELPFSAEPFSSFQPSDATQPSYFPESAPLDQAEPSRRFSDVGSRPIGDEEAAALPFSAEPPYQGSTSSENLPFQAPPPPQPFPENDHDPQFAQKDTSLDNPFATDTITEGEIVVSPQPGKKEDLKQQNEVLIEKSDGNKKSFLRGAAGSFSAAVQKYFPKILTGIGAALSSGIVRTLLMLGGLIVLIYMGFVFHVYENIYQFGFKLLHPPPPPVVEVKVVPAEWNEWGITTVLLFAQNRGSVRDAVANMIQNAFYFGMLAEPHAEGETGITPAYFYGTLADIAEQTNRFIAYVKNLKTVQDLYHVDLYAMLDQTTARDKKLLDYLQQLHDHRGESQKLFQELQLNIDDLKVSLASLNTDRTRFETDFFVSLQDLAGEKADFLLKSFVDTAQKQDSLKARLGALQKLAEYYTQALQRLDVRIKAVESNKDALIQGIHVIDIPGANLDIIIKGTAP